MKTYIAKIPIRHNGQSIAVGDRLPVVSTDDVERLLQLGAIEPAANDVNVGAADDARPTKRELLNRARELGLDVSAKMTVDALLDAIASATGNVGDESVDQAVDLPPGIDPKLK